MRKPLLAYVVLLTLPAFWVSAAKKSADRNSFCGRYQGICSPSNPGDLSMDYAIRIHVSSTGKIAGEAYALTSTKDSAGHRGLRRSKITIHGRIGTDKSFTTSTYRSKKGYIILSDGTKSKQLTAFKIKDYCEIRGKLARKGFNGDLLLTKIQKQKSKNQPLFSIKENPSL